METNINKKSKNIGRSDFLISGIGSCYCSVMLLVTASVDSR